MVKNDIICYSLATRWYQQILEIFHFDHQQDIKSRDLLFQFRSQFNPTSLLQTIEQILIKKEIYFFGTGPNLIGELKLLLPSIQQNRLSYFLTAADGAARALREYQIKPDLIVSDLDGLLLQDLVQFQAWDIPLLIHAHGDNQDRLHATSTLLTTYEKVIGTTQVDARWPIINPGGFTDGDRGLYFLHWLAPQEKVFHLVGYDFGNYIGRYSKPNFNKDMPMTSIKKKKLTFSQKLIQNLQTNEHRKIFFYHGS